MSRFKPGFVDQLVQAVDLAEIVGQHTRLTRRGNEWVGCCPFHKEKSPSFTLNPDKGLYYCFGCQAKGNTLGFVMAKEKLEFAEAVQWLARHMGVPVEMETRDRPGQADTPTPLGALALAQKFYHRVLVEHPAGQQARDYLTNRGIGEKEIRHFGIGLAPPVFSALLDHLSKKGYPLSVLMEAGLVEQRGGGSARDVFRGRVVFPIHNLQGQVVAFGGRVFAEDLKTINAPQAKYYNSADNPLFQKRMLLFHLFQARRVARRTGVVVLAEGYLDVVAFFRAGVAEAVAGMGTALTEEQVGLLLKTAKQVVLAYDRDPAGQRALHKNALALLSQGAQVRVAALPQGQDPDDLLRAQGPDVLHHLVATAQPYFLYHLHSALEGAQRHDPIFQVNLQKELLHLLTLAKDPTLEAAVIKEMALMLPHADERAMKRQFYQQKRQPRPPPHAPPQPAGTGAAAPTLPAPAPRGQRAYGYEGLLLGAALGNPALFDQLKDLDEELFEEKYYKSIFFTLRNVASLEELNNLVAQRGINEENPTPAFLRRIRAEKASLFSEAVFQESLDALTQRFDKNSLAQALAKAFERKTSRRPPSPPPT